MHSHVGFCPRHVIPSVRSLYAQIEYLQHEALASIPSLAKSYETLQDWKWRYGA